MPSAILSKWDAKKKKKKKKKIIKKIFKLKIISILNFNYLTWKKKKKKKKKIILKFLIDDCIILFYTYKITSNFL